ncbi:hemocyte protein-glutamine gamma-glutamyltransferase-like isoform X1 [Octopus vulgaris]|uniref:protein-glutamine gamma-glutamyltransferase n=1 Tax=Octopus vulgaris TaxID=6645 RepID=A0AA36AVM4_OCTVU|nr:hemocyte protein-glutamine gamma-glutamyltransferase-like isoform X1 [Octopus vulgaris]
MGQTNMFSCLRCRKRSTTESAIEHNAGTRRNSSYYRRHLGRHTSTVVGEEINGSVDPTPGCLKVEDVDFKILKNTNKHETDEYSITSKVNDENEKQIPKLVLRRGFSFTVVIRFNRPYNAQTDRVSLQFAFGERPKLVKGSLVRLELTDTFKEGQWAAVLKNSKDSEITVEVHTPPNNYVGVWRMRVNIKIDEKKIVYTEPYEFYMLFNPFHKRDEVYMADEAERKEYVMRESGKIYVGTSHQIFGKTWNFRQFSDDVLECVLYLLEESELPLHARRNPVLVTRKLTALINSSDDNGVLTGNWSGVYTGGKSPLAWTGSAAIFQEYFKTKRPVKFGQCWVFSGVLTTALRALGIPARSVTNFSSAHDTDVSVTIDHFYDELGQPEEHMNEDSVWNFHVWNEVHMARPDLKDGYGGWQACDSTPQETSDGIYCCGPCPVKAIKTGDTTALYDAPFIFAEVNADKISWILMPDGNYKSYIQSGEIGKNISTKAVLKNDRNDVTCEYKCAEGSAAERAAVLRAVNTAAIRTDAYKQGPQDMKFEIDVDFDAMFGSDVLVKLKMENTSNEVRHVGGSISAVSVFYTGVKAKDINKSKINCTVQPKSNGVAELLLTFNDYYKTMVDHCGIHLTAVTFVSETMQYCVLEEDFRLRKPDVTLKTPVKVSKLRPFDVEVSFTNPLKVALTNCILTVEGPGLQRPQTHPQCDVKPNETFHTTLKLTPIRVGTRSVCVGFTSEQLAGLEQESEIEVTE